MKDSYKVYLKQLELIKKLEERLHDLRFKSESDLNALVTDELEVMKVYEALAIERGLDSILLYQFFQGRRRLAGLVNGQVIINPFNVPIQDEILSELEQRGRKLANMKPGEAIYFINTNVPSNALCHIRGIRINLGHYVNNEKFRL